jgi:uncharacterized protein YndB with AHSA1/START domain
MTTTTDTAAEAVATTTQVYKVYIKASAEKIWQAITDPEWTNRYGYTGYTHYDLRPGGALKVLPNDAFKAGAEAQGYPCPDVLIDGEVLEVDPPHKLVTTWRMLMDPGLAAEGFTRLTYEIKEIDEGYCSLTVVHDLTGAPNLALLVSGANEDQGQGGGGGHAWILSDLKSLLETGSTLAG